MQLYKDIFPSKTYKIPGKTEKGGPKPSLPTVNKASQSLPCEAQIKFETIFGRGVYVDKNTAQAASVEFGRFQRTNYARSRLQKTAESPNGGFGGLKGGPKPSFPCTYL